MMTYPEADEKDEEAGDNNQEDRKDYHQGQMDIKLGAYTGHHYKLGEPESILINISDVDTLQPGVQVYTNTFYVMEVNVGLPSDYQHPYSRWEIKLVPMQACTRVHTPLNLILSSDQDYWHSERIDGYVFGSGNYKACMFRIENSNAIACSKCIATTMHITYFPKDVGNFTKYMNMFNMYVSNQ
jgi:hypothetical protein